MLALKLLSKKKFKYFILIFEMIICSTILLSLIGRFQCIISSKYLTDAYRNENAYYININSYLLTDTNSPPDSFYEAVKNAPYKICIGEIKNVNLRIDGKPYDCIGYNKDIINSINTPLSKGVWFNKYKLKYRDIIPIVSIGSNYKVGDNIMFTIGNSPKELLGVVIGILPNKSYIPTFKSGGSNNNSSVQDFISSVSNTFLIPLEKLHYITDISIIDQPNKIIIAQKGTTQKNIMDTLGKYGGISSIKKMESNYLDDLFSYFISNGVCFIFFVLLSIAGIGGINALENIENKRKFSIYYILGISPKKCALIEAIRAFVIFILSFIGTIVMYNIPFFTKLYNPQTMHIDIITFSFVLIFMLIIYLITSGYNVIMLSKTNPIDNYKSYN